MDRAQSSVDMMDLIIESLDSVLVLVYVVDFFSCYDTAVMTDVQSCCIFAVMTHGLFL